MPINSTCSSDVLFIEWPDENLIETPQAVSCDGGAVRVSFNVEDSKVAYAAVCTGKPRSHKGLPVHLYGQADLQVHDLYITGSDAQLNSKYIKYYMYHNRRTIHAGFASAYIPKFMHCASVQEDRF